MSDLVVEVRNAHVNILSNNILHYQHQVSHKKKEHFDLIRAHFWCVHTRTGQEWINRVFDTLNWHKYNWIIEQHEKKPTSVKTFIFDLQSLRDARNKRVCVQIRATANCNPMSTPRHISDREMATRARHTKKTHPRTHTHFCHPARRPAKPFWLNPDMRNLMQSRWCDLFSACGGWEQLKSEMCAIESPFLRGRGNE